MCTGLKSCQNEENTYSAMELMPLIHTYFSVFVKISGLNTLTRNFSPQPQRSELSCQQPWKNSFQHGLALVPVLGMWRQGDPWVC